MQTAMNSIFPFWKRMIALLLSALLMMPVSAQSRSSKKQTKQSSSSPLTVLFIGDSITDGNRTRDNDWNHVMGHGYAQMLAARLWFEQPGRFAMFYNRGISGNTIADLAARWQTDCIDLKPDVVSILVGINDVHGIANGYLSQSIDEFEATYRAVLDSTRAALPQACIVMCEPFLLPGSRVDANPEVWQRETKSRRMVVRALANEYGAVFVPLQHPFDEALKKAPVPNWIWDGIHPMPAGHELIAREWLKAMGW